MAKENLLYTESHEWVEPVGDIRTVGITDHAQHMLGDIVFVELPEVGTIVSKGDELLVVESPKAAAEVYAPLSGEVVEINSALENQPDLINKGAFDEGWLVKIKVSDPGEGEALMALADYQKIVDG